jgi:5-methylcytosine-specific restriction endonuclease McrA
MLRACPTCARHQTKPSQRTGRPRGSTWAWRKLRARAIARDRRCIVCGTTEQLEADHVVPVEHGGRDELTNVVIRCRRCHAVRHGKTLYS